MIQLRLPYPPSANVYRTHARGRWFVSAKGRRYHNDVQAVVLSTLGVPTPMACRLAVQLEFVMPDRRKRDLDNALKIIFDSLQASRVIEDDKLIDHLVVKRLHVESPGCVDVVIQPLEVYDAD